MRSPSLSRWAPREGSPEDGERGLDVAYNASFPPVDPESEFPGLATAAIVLECNERCGRFPCRAAGDICQIGNYTTTPLGPGDRGGDKVTVHCMCRCRPSRDLGTTGQGLDPWYILYFSLLERGLSELEVLAKMDEFDREADALRGDFEDL